MNLEQEFADHLESFEPKPEIAKLFSEIVQDVYEQKAATSEKNRAMLLRQLRDVEKMKAEADRLMLRGTFDEETYRDRARELRDEIADKQMLLKEAEMDTEDFKAALNFCSYFASNLSQLWLNASPENKQRVQSTVFSEGIFYDKQSGFRTPIISPIFKALSDLQNPKRMLGVPKGI